jgi:molecular chaperone HtpG
MQRALSDRVSAVWVTHRLTDSPACLVVEQRGMSTNLERMLRPPDRPLMCRSPILEVNPHHPIVERLRTEGAVRRRSRIFFDQATLAEGGQLNDPAMFGA